MYAPRVFISMMCALLVFAVATYFIHGSFYTAFIQTIICLVIIQVGYFIGVVVLVAREKRQMRETLGFQKETPPAAEQSVTENITVVPHHHAKLTDF
nr:exopolysaccharide production repressor protein [Agrobacterium sp. rho-13.3]MDX8306397.1 exopolysaccharide production repressor protein [Agrobacterium sp. rho-13.3]MDX8307272.1 exopolysaccharide production repressor protein [Agrobacterium sp. rho-13.3]